MILGKFAVRDYSLTGNAQDLVGLNEDLIEERVEGTWWSPDIPRQELKAMMKRSLPRISKDQWSYSTTAAMKQYRETMRPALKCEPDDLQTLRDSSDGL